MNHLLPYNDRSSRIGELLDMVERGCERFTRCGSLIRNSDESYNVPVSEAKRAEMFRRVGAGEDMHQVAADLGVHYQTVVRFTRRLRGVEGGK